MTLPACRLYLITPPVIDDMPAFLTALEAALSAGDVAALQVRLKDVPDARIEGAVRAIAPITQRHGVALILNDDPALAARLGCDGVHIGQEDGTVQAARKAMPGGMIGVTCHDSRHLAMEAAEAGADYVAFGAFFHSATKIVTTPADLEILEWWSGLMEVPCVAIGGITVENCRPVVAAGALWVGDGPRGSPLLWCTGIGFGREPAHINSGEALRADGLTLAIQSSLGDAGCQLHELDFRITDNSGEQYYFKEASLALSRTMRQSKDTFDIWHPAECTGEAGAVSGVAVIAAADDACRKGYSPGPGVLSHWANDAGQRAAVTLEYGAAA